MFSALKRAITGNSLALLCMALFMLSANPALLLAAGEIRNASLIRQYVDEDKVYLLENIRQNFTRPSEKLVIEALLCEDGPKAKALYRRQLKDYPDPELDRISTSRINAYNLALNSTVPPHRLSQQRSSGASGNMRKSEIAGTKEGPGTASAMRLQEKNEAKTGAFTLQFGSFGNLQNAETLARKVSFYANAEVLRRDGIFRVRLKKAYPTRDDAADAGRQLPFDAMVVPSGE